LEKEHHDTADKVAKVRQLEPFLNCWRGFWQALKTAEVKTGLTESCDGMFGLPMTNANLEQLRGITDCLVERFTINQNNNVTVELSLPVLDSIQQDAIRSRQVHMTPWLDNQSSTALLLAVVVAFLFGWWFPEKGAPEHGCFESNINTVIDNGPPYEPINGNYQARGILCRLGKE